MCLFHAQSGITARADAFLLPNPRPDTQRSCNATAPPCGALVGVRQVFT